MGLSDRLGLSLWAPSALHGLGPSCASSEEGLQIFLIHPWVTHTLSSPLSPWFFRTFKTGQLPLTALSPWSLRRNGHVPAGTLRGLHAP